MEVEVKLKESFPFLEIKNLLRTDIFYYGNKIGTSIEIPFSCFTIKFEKEVFKYLEIKLDFKE